jgi:hypothetical protein
VHRYRRVAAASGGIPAPHICDAGGLVARITADPCDGPGPGQFISPQGRPSIRAAFLYVGEVAFTAWPNLYPQRPIPDRLRSLQKFDKISATGV